MKKVLVWILTLCLCITSMLPSAALAQEDTAEDRILLDWFYYLFSYEKLAGNLLWVYDSIDAFAQERTWENLLIARAAASVAQQVIEGISLPEGAASAEDYVELMLSGKDVSSVQYAYENFAIEWQFEVDNFAELLKPYLHEEVFWIYTAESYEKNFQVRRNVLEYALATLALETNHLVNALNNKASTERIIQFLEKNCPRILAYQQKLTGDDATLKERYKQYLEKMEAANSELALLEGQTDYAADLYIQAVENNDFSRMSPEKTEIANLPLMLLYPGWYSSVADSFHYLWSRDDGSLTQAAEYEELVSPPNACLMTAQSVPLEDVKLYQAYLEYLGLSCTKTEETDEHCRLFYQMEDIQFVLTHKNNTLEWYMCQTPVCLVPEWYLSE